MMWVKIDDAILDNPKILRAGFIGFGVHVAGIAFCGRNLTDGFVPYEKVATLVDLSVLFTNAGCPLGSPRDEIKGGAQSPDVYSVVDELVEIGLWHEAYQGERLIGYKIHDYDKYNPSREEVLAKREKERAKKQKSRVLSPGESPGESAGNPRPPVPVPVPGSVPTDQKKKLAIARKEKSEIRTKETAFPALDYDLTLARAQGCRRPAAALESFKTHALTHDRRCANWRQAWRQWCLHHDLRCPCHQAEAHPNRDRVAETRAMLAQKGL